MSIIDLDNVIYWEETKVVLDCLFLVQIEFLPPFPS